MASVSTVPTMARNAEFQKMRGTSTWVKKPTMLVQSASPNVALPLMMSAAVLVLETIIQKNGKIEMKAATSSSR